MIQKSRSLEILGVLALVGIGAGPLQRSAEPEAADSAAIPPDSARRIVSLVPAATEILFALGAGDRLVGRSHWGVHPPEARRVPDVGDGIRPSLEVVLAQRPDLVVLYEGAANREVAQRLEGLKVPVLRLQHDTLGDLERNIGLLGAIGGCPAGAERLARQISRGLEVVVQATQDRARIRVYFDAWEDPPITIGRGSFLDSLITIAGGTNIFGDLEGSAPRVSLEAIVRRRPERILVTVPETELERAAGISGRPDWRQIEAVAVGRISLLDRDLLGRLGPRVPEAAADIALALHPDLEFPELRPSPVRCGP